MEASLNPGKAIPAAERLPGMMPAAGHLEHMPAHIMQRVGRYEGAAEANRKGVAADLAYFALDQAARLLRHVHRSQLPVPAFSAAMEGRQAETMEAVRQSRALVPDDMLLMMPGIDWYTAELYAAMVRFGLWDEILAEPCQTRSLIGLTGAYLYAKATALAAKGRIDDAKSGARRAGEAGGSGADEAPASIASRMCWRWRSSPRKARIALAENKGDEAIGLLREAVARKTSSPMTNPPTGFSRPATFWERC